MAAAAEAGSWLFCLQKVRVQEGNRTNTSCKIPRLDNAVKRNLQNSYLVVSKNILGVPTSSLYSLDIFPLQTLHKHDLEYKEKGQN